jgi:serine/threonine-protein kinase
VAASNASDSTIAAAGLASAAADLVIIDPATYRGLTEAQARTTLSAAGFDVATTTAGSAADLAGLVIDVQPTGPVAPGSTVTIALGDGTIALVNDPPTDDPRTGNNGNGNSEGKGKGKGKGND